MNGQALELKNVTTWIPLCTPFTMGNRAAADA